MAKLKYNPDCADCRKKKTPLSVKLTGLAEWLDGQGLNHNAKLVRKAARLIARDIERGLSKPKKR